MEPLVANIFPNITSVQTLDNVIRCAAQSSVPSSHLSSHNFKRFFFALTMIIITMIHTVTCHVCHLWIRHWENTGRVYENMDGRVRVWSRPGKICLASMQSRPEPHWTVMGPAGESCSYQSHHAGSPSDCGR